MEFVGVLALSPAMGGEGGGGKGSTIFG